MSLAIHTKFLGATDTKGSRVMAVVRLDRDTTWRITLPYDHALNHEQMHAAAAAALVEKRFQLLAKSLANGAVKISVCGNTLDNLGYVFTLLHLTMKPETAQQLAYAYARAWQLAKGETCSVVPDRGYFIVQPRGGLSRRKTSADLIRGLSGLLGPNHKHELWPDSGKKLY